MSDSGNEESLQHLRSVLQAIRDTDNKETQPGGLTIVVPESDDEEAAIGDQELVPCYQCLTCSFRCLSTNKLCQHMFHTHHGLVKCHQCDTLLVSWAFAPGMQKVIRRELKKIFLAAGHTRSAAGAAAAALASNVSGSLPVGMTIVDIAKENGQTSRTLLYRNTSSGSTSHGSWQPGSVDLDALPSSANVVPRIETSERHFASRHHVNGHVEKKLKRVLISRNEALALSATTTPLIPNPNGMSSTLHSNSLTLSGSVHTNPPSNNVSQVNSPLLLRSRDGGDATRFMCPECFLEMTSWTQMTKHLDATRHAWVSCSECGTQLKCYGPTQPHRHTQTTGHQGIRGVFRIRADFALDRFNSLVANGVQEALRELQQFNQQRQREEQLVKTLPLAGQTDLESSEQDSTSILKKLTFEKGVDENSCNAPAELPETIEVVIPCSVRQFVCPACGIGFVRMLKLLAHLVEQHQVPEDRGVNTGPPVAAGLPARLGGGRCEACDEYLPNLTAMRIHAEKAAATGEGNESSVFGVNGSGTEKDSPTTPLDALGSSGSPPGVALRLAAEPHETFLMDCSELALQKIVLAPRVRVPTTGPATHSAKVPPRPRKPAHRPVRPPPPWSAPSMPVLPSPSHPVLVSPMMSYGSSMGLTWTVSPVTQGPNSPWFSPWADANSYAPSPYSPAQDLRMAVPEWAVPPMRWVP